MHSAILPHPATPRKEAKYEDLMTMAKPQLVDKSRF